VTSIPARRALQDLLAKRQLIVAPGVFDGLSAHLLRRTGHVVAYLTGAGVAASGFGLPDIGLVTQTEMAERIRMIVRALGDIPLIADADTGYGAPMNVVRTVHGFAILDRLRAWLPRARSVLMDRETLLAHRDRWVTEDRQATSVLRRLTPDEQALYSSLVVDGLGERVRLEQERIGWHWVEQRLPAVNRESDSDCVHRSKMCGRPRIDKEVLAVDRCHVVTKDAVRRAAARSAKASAKLENRVVPAGFIRSPAVKRFLAARNPRP
jgi:hypothetical protein